MSIDLDKDLEIIEAAEADPEYFHIRHTSHVLHAKHFSPTYTRQLVDRIRELEEGISEVITDPECGTDISGQLEGLLDR